MIAAGKLAVIIGIESSDLFGCSEHGGKAAVHARRHRPRAPRRTSSSASAECSSPTGSTTRSPARRSRAARRAIFINILNRFQTGSYFTTGRCPGAGQGVDACTTLSKPCSQLLAGFFPAAKPIAAQGMPTYPTGLQCNTDGLTPLGRYLIKQLIAQHMLIEVDHISERARDEVLSIAEQAHYPLISSHNGTGGEWTPAELARLYRLGGFAAVTPDQAPALRGKILADGPLQQCPYYFGVGIGTDTGGFASLPGPRADAATRPLRYPFKSFDGKVTFAPEQTGSRTFDLNTDGVAHYGLLPDLLADMQRGPGGRQAMSLLFRSAEAYLETWQRAVAHR